MAGKTYRLKVSRDGQEFEAEGDKRFVLEMLKRFVPAGPLDDTSSPGKVQVEKGQTRSVPTRGRTLSLREFIQQIGLKKHTDITVAFAYYLEKYAGIKEFTPADINNCYYEAKLEASNTSQMIIHNIKTGRMMASKKKRDEKGRNRYTLTATGESFIESKLSRSS
jgi:predicted transcriptional regulator